LDVFFSPDAMPSSRRNLTLDEESFQGLLSAAFTIQKHNDQRKRARPAPEESEGERVGQRGDAPHCENSGVDQLRPGERLQHNWASMWRMSQGRGLWPERSAEVAEKPIAQKTNDAIHEQGERGLGDSGFHDPLIIKPAFNRPALNRPALVEPATEGRRTTEAIIKALVPEDLTREDADPAGEPFALSASDEFSPVFSPDLSPDFSPDVASIDASAGSNSWMVRLADGRVKLRFRRADLYLGTAIVVAALALLWPAAGSPRRAALSPWERALVTIGIAEAPAPAIHLQGDPGIEVWVDPHSALYYCPGEEQYGKTSDGRMSSQHDAQMDRFEPAGRSACE
jgi:hypothetical protein